MASEIDAAAILKRLDRSAPDALLTSLASELASLHQAHQGLLARIVAIETFQSISDQVLTSIAAVPLAKSVLVDAAFPLTVEQGFYPVEQDSAGTPYRWTGPTRTFYFELFIDRSAPCILALRFLRLFAVPLPMATVQCFVDGQPVESETDRVKQEFELHATLPSREMAGGTVVTFVCPATTSPREQGASKDDRSLGLAFRWLKIESALAEKTPEAGTGSQNSGEVVAFESHQAAAKSGMSSVEQK